MTSPGSPPVFYFEEFEHLPSMPVIGSDWSSKPDCTFYFWAVHDEFRRHYLVEWRHLWPTDDQTAALSLIAMGVQAPRPWKIAGKMYASLAEAGWIEHCPIAALPARLTREGRRALDDVRRWRGAPW